VTVQVTNTLPKRMLSPFSRGVAHRLDSVVARPSLRRTQCIQAIGVGAGIRVRDNLATSPVLGGHCDTPLDLVWRKRDFEFPKDFLHIEAGSTRTLVFSWHGDAPSISAWSWFCCGVEKVVCPVRRQEDKVTLKRPVKLAKHDDVSRRLSW